MNGLKFEDGSKPMVLQNEFKNIQLGFCVAVRPPPKLPPWSEHLAPPSQI